MDQLLLRPEEAARRLGIGRSKLFELLAAGELPVVRIGHCTRIPAADLARWVEARTDGRPPAPVDGRSGRRGER